MAEVVGVNAFVMVLAFAVSKGTCRFGGFVLGGPQKQRDSEGVRQQQYHQLNRIRRITERVVSLADNLK